MTRIIALDLGDSWTGIAIADPLGITARPYETVKTEFLESYILNYIGELSVKIIIVGHPQTLRGTKSHQTLKVEESVATLKQKFPAIDWIFWDERLTSKQASCIKPAKTKEKKLHQHAIAAALILQTYLEHLSFVKNTDLQNKKN